MWHAGCESEHSRSATRAYVGSFKALSDASLFPFFGRAGLVPAPLGHGPQWCVHESKYATRFRLDEDQAQLE